MCVHYTKICVRTQQCIKCMFDSRILAERVYIKHTSVSERNIIAKCAFENKILAERVQYMKPTSASGRNDIAKFAFEHKILEERVYIKPTSVSERNNIPICMFETEFQWNVCTLDLNLCQTEASQQNACLKAKLYQDVCTLDLNRVSERNKIAKCV